MKLLLTSNGLTNDALKKIFLDLLFDDPQDTMVAFILTASNMEKDKSYIDNSIETLKSINLNHINPIDIAKEKEEWEKTIEEADIVWMEGGNTFYLMDQLNKSGFGSLKEDMNDKIYIGVSAGSIVVTPDISIATVTPADPNAVGLTDMKGLGWVDFEVSPHTPDVVSFENFEKYAKTTKRTMYGFDDKTALFVEKDQVRVVGEGNCRMLNFS